MTVQSKNDKTYNMFLTGIAAAISTSVAALVILTSVDFTEGTDFDTATAFPIAYTAGVSVFGAFLYKIYRMTSKERMAEPSIPVSQHCLILAAPTHGVLQDRANYWLSGKYGTVKSTTMSTMEKGFYLAIFYEAIEIKALEEKKVEQ